jgi:MarR family transcriptional regulator, organic hydroperoxide resistance regulator
LRQSIVSIYNEFVPTSGKSGRKRAKTEDSPPDPGREIWNLLYRLFQAGRPAMMAICQEYELTPPQAFLLRYLEPGKPIAMNGLAGALGCDASNITGLVDKLEARGLIQRQPDRTDRRVKMIVVTEAGVRFRQELLGRLLEPPGSLACLPKGEKRTLREILKRVVEAAEQGGDSGPRTASAP